MNSNSTPVMKTILGTSYQYITCILKCHSNGSTLSPYIDGTPVLALIYALPIDLLISL